MDPCIINGDHISVYFCFLHKNATEGMDAKSLETTSKGTGSTITKKATVKRNMQGIKISRIFYISNLGDWDSIL